MPMPTFPIATLLIAITHYYTGYAKAECKTIIPTFCIDNKQNINKDDQRAQGNMCMQPNMPMYTYPN